jgi:hypothetical protein
MPEVRSRRLPRWKLINRETKQCRYIEIFVAYKFKIALRPCGESAIAALVKRVAREGLRRDLAKVLELFWLLRYLEFIERDLTTNGPEALVADVFSS